MCIIVVTVHTAHLSIVTCTTTWDTDTYPWKWR